MLATPSIIVSLQASTSASVPATEFGFLATPIMASSVTAPNFNASGQVDLPPAVCWTTNFAEGSPAFPPGRPPLESPPPGTSVSESSPIEPSFIESLGSPLCSSSPPSYQQAQLGTASSDDNMISHLTPGGMWVGVRCETVGRACKPALGSFALILARRGVSRPQNLNLNSPSIRTPGCVAEMHGE